MKQGKFFPFLVCMMLFLGLVVPLIPVGADDIRMVDVFSADEAAAVAVVSYLYRNQTLEVETFSYGGLFYYVPLVLLKIWGWVGAPMAERVMILGMRGVCALAGVGCLWLTWRLGRLVFGRWAGWIGLVLLGLTPTFLRWSVEIHPDLPQLFWILGCLYFCCLLTETGRLQDACLAALMAGLAFGTKYAGVFLLPVIVFSAFLFAQGRPGRSFWMILGCILLVFGVTFVVTNPYALIHFETFRQDIAFERAHLGFGHVFRADGAGLRWLTDLWALVGWGHGLILLGVGGIVGVGLLRKQRTLSVGSLVLLFWTGLFLIYLTGFANLRAPRHLLPVLPAVLLMVGKAYLWGSREVAARLGRLDRQPLVWIPAMVLLSLPQFDHVAQFYTARWNRAQGRSEIVAGKWIGEHFSEDTAILFDMYSYVPAKFRDVFRSSGQSYTMVHHFEPDLIVVRDAIANRFLNRDRASQAQMGEAAFLDRHFFYRYITEEKLPDYRLSKQFDRVRIYQRSLPKSDAFRQVSWTDRVVLLGQGRLHGAAEAYRKLGDLHTAHGLHTEAEAAYRKAELASRTPGHLLAQGRDFLENGEIDRAKQVFVQALSLASAQSAVLQGAVYLQMARFYMEAGFGQEAIRGAQQALEQNPALRDAHFDLGLFYLAGGDFKAAEAAYQTAVGKYGPDPSGRKMLQKLVQRGIQAVHARQILATYFGSRVEP